MRLLLQRIRLPLTEFTLEADVEIQSQMTAIFGPSGAGKTSLLDLVAGLRRPNSALIQLHDRVLTDTARGLNVPARSREIGYVPQDLALFPHLSVRGNLLFGYKAPSNSLFSFEHIIDVMEIQPLMTRGVTDLSGGEKQRVALARALLTVPRLVLLDEPLASLDLKLKAKIIPYLGRVRDEFHLPMLYVTHDPAEAAALCDEVLVMERGRFVRRGEPDAIFADFSPFLAIPAGWNGSNEQKKHNTKAV
jgi:molybdate transport system ATP-binding protein